MSGRGLVGLIGVLVAVISTELNDLVTNLALVDIRGGLGLSVDQASWLRGLYVTGQIIGMSTAPALGLSFSIRRFALFGITLSGIANILFVFGGPAPILFALRFTQGLAEGFVIPLLITVALKVLTPQTRLYGLALYALTATFIPNLGASVAALWVDVVHDWRFLFLESAPLCLIAALLVWSGMPQEPPQLERLDKFDWPGLLWLTIGFGSLSTVLEQGDRLDWFNSIGIGLGTLTSVIAIGAFLINETRAEVPLFRFELFKKRNFAYAIICLFTFLLVNLSSSTLPTNFLEQVDGYRPAQYFVVTLQIAVAQLILLPATAWALDQPKVDSRIVSAVGFVCILCGCLGGITLDSTWNRNEFLVLQALQAVGQPLVIMPLLLMATNTLNPESAPFASATINTARALSEAVGFWLVTLIARLRGGLHTNRILDWIGENRIALQQQGRLPVGATEPGGQGAADHAIQGLQAIVQREVTALVTIDTFIVFGGLVVFLLCVLAILPQRTYPPRVVLAQNK